MAIQNVNAAAAASTATNPLKMQVASQDDFLKLLITQLQNQDPLEPMDNQEFATQLATFNSLGQLIEINDKLGAMTNGQGSMNQYNAASLIGKQITSAGNQVSVSAGAASNSAISWAPTQPRSWSLCMTPMARSSGVSMPARAAAGEQTLVWDGKDSAGKSVRPGVYGFDINAVDSQRQEDCRIRQTSGLGYRCAARRHRAGVGSERCRCAAQQRHRGAGVTLTEELRCRFSDPC